MSVTYINPSSRSSPVSANHRHSSHTVPSAFVAVAATCSKPCGTTASGSGVVFAAVSIVAAVGGPVVEGVVDGAGDVPGDGVTVTAGKEAAVVEATSSSPPQDASTRAVATTSHRMATTVASGPRSAGSGDAADRCPQQACQRPAVAWGPRDQQ